MEKELLQQILNEITDVKNTLNHVSAQVDENTKVLRALEDSISVAKADISSIKKDICDIKNNIDFVEKATVKNLYDISNLKSVR